MWNCLSIDLSISAFCGCKDIKKIVNNVTVTLLNSLKKTA